jgi:hypothetical protein
VGHTSSSTGFSISSRRFGDEREWAPELGAGSTPPGLVPLDDVRDSMMVAGRTLGLLRGRVGPPEYVLSSWSQMALEEFETSYPVGGPEPRRPVPSALEISHMDWVTSWLSLIPNDRWVTRRIVAARMLTNERTGKVRYSYKHLSERIRASSQAVMLWHRQGLVMIQRRLDPKNPNWDRFFPLRQPMDGA